MAEFSEFDSVVHILSSTHADYDESVDAWKKNETFFNGGEAIFNEGLKRYQWEKASAATTMIDDEGNEIEISGQDAFEDRKETAVYVPFPEVKAELFAGLIFKDAPMPTWGSLGTVRPPAERTGTLSAAEQILKSTDGVGTDSHGWFSFWEGVSQRSQVTDFRWVMVESPQANPNGVITVEDEINGVRPYLVEFSPIDVKNWHFENGVLQWARITVRVRRFGMYPNESGWQDENPEYHYLLVREGFSGFGPTFQRGGWWWFDDQMLPVRQENGELLSGNWDSTGGKIPMFRVRYKRGHKGGDSGNHIRRISIRFMNLLAALYNDAWVSGSRKLFFGGVSPEQWKVILTHGMQNGNWVPIPADPNVSRVTIHDIATATASEAIMSAIESTLGLVARYFVKEITTSPDASGEAKSMEHLANQAPALSHMARNIQEAQTTALHFLEMRWKGTPNPSASVQWPKDFDVRGAFQKIRSVLEVLALDNNLSSPTLVGKLYVAALKAAGIQEEVLSEDGDIDTIISELGTEKEAQKINTERAKVGVEQDRQNLAASREEGDDEEKEDEDDE